ncbi:hypothetical protein [Sedimentibacter saalensis]|uniref:Uncharacterized protein n=1 Tax=Sedimentibacter saalensis TaxID=130788 RepID=A0A562IZM1_9FIRM|nr:hypothetical protein [Sedimentibacter saalensis]TWH76378.1 hypothetical protein LY60_03657 [Sedimentibacter saalensis]
MLQVHSIILWANAKNDEFKTSVDRAYALIMALKEFGTELSPNYLTAKRKKDAKPFDYTYETLEELIRKGVNKEGKTVFADLGYSVSFFSSLVEQDSAGIKFHVGTSNPKFIDTFIIHLPQTCPIYTDTTIGERLINLFKKCVDIFDPFWGCLGNGVNARRYDGYWGDTLPTSTHWINYFGESVTKQLSVTRIEKCPIYKVEKLSKGYFLQLKTTPIDDTNEGDIKIQANANKYFGF